MRHLSWVPKRSPCDTSHRGNANSNSPHGIPPFKRFEAELLAHPAARPHRTRFIANISSNSIEIAVRTVILRRNDYFNGVRCKVEELGTGGSFKFIDLLPPLLTFDARRTG